MNYPFPDPQKQAARDFIAAHLHQGDLLPHLAMYFEIAAASLEPLLELELELTTEQRDTLLAASERLRTGFNICVELPHHSTLTPHVEPPVEV